MLPSLNSKSCTRREALRGLGALGGLALATRFTGTARAADRTKELPGLSGAQPGFYRFKIGAFEALAINDGQFALPIAQSPFGVGEPQGSVENALRAAYLPTDIVRISINVLLVRTGSELVLVDSGCGTVFGPAGGRVTANLKAAGIQPEQITTVVLSHLHGDHFGGLLDPATKQPIYKNARHVMNRREHDYWMNHPDLSKSPLPPDTRTEFIRNAQGVVNALKGKWELIAPGDKLIEGVEIVDAAGHTPGHIALTFTSGTDQLVNFVDVAHHQVISFRHPQWKVAFDADPDHAAKTRQRMLDRFATDRARVFGVHMPFPALGRISSSSGKFEYHAEPWQPV